MHLIIIYHWTFSPFQHLRMHTKYTLFAKENNNGRTESQGRCVDRSAASLEIKCNFFCNRIRTEMSIVLFAAAHNRSLANCDGGAVPKYIWHDNDNDAVFNSMAMDSLHAHQSNGRKPIWLPCLCRASDFIHNTYVDRAATIQETNPRFILNLSSNCQIFGCRHILHVITAVLILCTLCHRAYLFWSDACACMCVGAAVLRAHQNMRTRFYLHAQHSGLARHNKGWRYSTQITHLGSITSTRNDC